MGDLCKRVAQRRCGAVKYLIPEHVLPDWVGQPLGHLLEACINVVMSTPCHLEPAIVWKACCAVGD